MQNNREGEPEIPERFALAPLKINVFIGRFWDAFGTLGNLDALQAKFVLAGPARTIVSDCY